MSSDAPSSPRLSLQDHIVTLPMAAIVALALLLLGALGVALWALAHGAEKVQEAAGPLLVVLFPLLFGVVAAIGLRRTSTREIDRLVNGFLDKTVLERLALACSDCDEGGFPFRKVELARSAKGRSYATYELAWAHDEGQPPVQARVKMNVFNIEVICELDLAVALSAPQTHLIQKANLGRSCRHKVLRHFHSTIHGAIEEGYAVKVTLVPLEGGLLRMGLTLRQKLREQFLASPYLKRYFAEDVTIAIGEVFKEWKQSGLMPRSGA